MAYLGKPIVINFSHPLSDEAKDRLGELLGGEFHLIEVHVHLDLERFRDSVTDVLARADEALHELTGTYDRRLVDAVVPPGLSTAAWVLSREYELSAMVLVLRDNSGLVTRFLPRKIVRW